MFRFLGFLYWLAGILTGLASVVWLVGFLANRRVPITVDQGFGAYLPSADALRRDIPLLLLFAAQHSLLPRHWLKERLSFRTHRATYFLTTGLVTFALMFLWEPLPDYVWYIRDTTARAVFTALSLAGAVLVFWGISAIGARSFFAISASEPSAMRHPGPYRFVRHPVMSGTLLVLWSTPEMSEGHALFSGFMTLYTLIALVFEERDLVRKHGEAYLSYRRGVKRLIPFVFTLGAFAQTIEVLDVQRVPLLGDPSSAVVSVAIPPSPREISCDALVAGGGMGGAAAALRLAERGHRVCLTEETDWVGGQMTAGGVSALDENRFIETTGATRNYYRMRNAIRDAYRHRQLSPEAARWQNLNPGSCYVSSLCFEPSVGVEVLERMLAAHPSRVHLLLRTAIIRIDVQGGVIRSALAYRFDTREVLRIRPKWVLDATEMGDLLPLAGIPYSAGSEPRSETGESHAAALANPACVQSFTYPFAAEHREGENHRVAKPEGYERIRDSQPFTIRMNYPVEFGWKGSFTYTVFGDEPPVPNNMSPGPFFIWRRLLAVKNFANNTVPRDVVLMNWPRQDYHDESVLDKNPRHAARILQAAKRVSYSFLYWMQTDIPRDDKSGTGYPGVFLRKDVMGTEDGLSKYPYIRESRRMKASTRVVQHDIVAENQPGSRARWYPDSVGTGFYMVDIHPCGANERGRMMMPKPFQVPMGTLIAPNVSNFLAAAKNLSVTHITNGAFRLHPIEWTIGEAAATVASLRLEGREASPPAVQEELARAGAPIVWFDDLSPTHPAFSAIQIAAIRGIYPLSQSDLHASPEAPVTRAEAATAIAAWLGYTVTRESAIALAVERGWMAVDHRNWFHADLPFYWTDLRAARLPQPLPAIDMVRTGPVKRHELAARLTAR